MRYYSDVTKEIYQSEDELKKAELAVQKKDGDRERRADEVKKAWNDANEATKKARKLTNEFVKDYHKFHMSLTEPISTDDFFDDFFFNWI